MYHAITYGDALEQIAALPDEALHGYADVLGVLALAPWSDQPQHEGNPEGDVRQLIPVCWPGETDPLTGRPRCHTGSFNDMAPRERTTKKITVTLPIEDAEAVERLAETGQIESVSRYVTEAVAFRRAREDGLAVLERRFGKPADYALEWARNLVARRLGSPGPTA